MAGVVVPFRARNLAPTRNELVERVQGLATDTRNMHLDHPHLRDRMSERGVSMRQVLEVLRKGIGVDGPTLDEYGDFRIKLRRKVAGRRIQVVVAVKETHFVAVTVI